MPKNLHLKPGSLAAWVDTLQSQGRYTFTRVEVMNALSVSAVALKRALRILKQKNRIASPLRGFYVIVPLEYRKVGAPPPSWFIEDFMIYVNEPDYYVGVLTAASMHGASHHQPLEFQVITAKTRRSLKSGRMRLCFLKKAGLNSSSRKKVKTETGFMQISSVEQTALDLFRYVRAAGGLDNIVTVLKELAGNLEGTKLRDVAMKDNEIAYVQRLGYLLKKVGATALGGRLAALIKSKHAYKVPLRPGRPVKGFALDKDFRVVVNAYPEPEA